MVFLKAIIEIWRLDDMVSLFMWNNKYKPSSALGTFAICENIWVLMSPLIVAFNALYSVWSLWMAL